MRFRRRSSTGGRSRSITSFARTLRSDAPPIESATNNASHRRRPTTSATTTRMPRGMSTALLPSQVTKRIASVQVEVRWSTNQRVTSASNAVEPSDAHTRSSRKPNPTVSVNATAKAMAIPNATRRGSWAGVGAVKCGIDLEDAGGARSDPEDLRLLGGEFLVGQHALVVELRELGQHVQVAFRRGRRSGWAARTAAVRTAGVGTAGARTAGAGTRTDPFAPTAGSAGAKRDCSPR